MRQVRLARLPGWTLLANRIGYLLVALAVATFVIGFAIGFSAAVATVVVVAMLAGFALLAPSIVLGLRGQGRRAGGPGNVGRDRRPGRLPCGNSYGSPTSRPGSS